MVIYHLKMAVYFCIFFSSSCQQILRKEQKVFIHLATPSHYLSLSVAHISYD